MDGNKDEALKCLKIAKQALKAGDRTRALKFLSKGRRLDPTLPIDDFLSSSEAGQSRDPPTSNDPITPESPDLSSSSSTTARVRVSSTGSSKSYTEEQVTIVKEIKKQKDYYQILGLDRNCTVEDVRKAYRKLSLKVHPDKNKAPGAEEAFKAVSKAFQCLSNEETKKRYDLVGSDEPNYGRPTARRSAGGFDGFYDGDIDPEEIFRNFFFGGGVHRAATPFGQFNFGGMGGVPNGHGMHGSGNFNIRSLIQMLPIIILLLVNFLPSSDPVFTFYRGNGYEYKVETPKGVPYFVKSAKFESDYPHQSSERAALERGIERDYLSLLSKNCHVELQRRQWGMTNTMPHCDMLQKLYPAA